MPSIKPQYKKLIFLALIGAVICTFFWLGSRYPALNLKSLMSAQTSFSGLSFDLLVPVTEQQQFFTRVLNTTINWLYSNMIGMSFGLLIAPIILSGFSLLAHLQPKNGVLASLLGAVIGSPLGVCANCATPIALGITAGKGRLETMLAVIISSPTLNIIAITMMLSVLPSFMVAIKLILTLGLILLFIPLLARRHVSTEFPALLTTRLNKGLHATSTEPPATLSWLHSLRWVIGQYGHNFLAIIKVALPFMILAGALGALLVNIIPADSLNMLRPEGYLAKTLALFGVSLIAALLPVPMTFDVIVAANLHHMGVETRYVSAALFGLGTFSIYPYLILRKYTSTGLANQMMLAVITCSFIAGTTSHYLSKPYKNWQEKQFQSQVVANAKPLPDIKHEPRKVYVKPSLVKSIPTTSIIETDAYRVSAAPFQINNNLHSSPTQFQRYLGDEIGLNTHYKISLGLFTDIGLFNGIATGDINSNGWDDVLVVDSSGLRLFINQGNLRFSELELASYTPSTNLITAAALADINNDGKLDIVFSTAYEGIKLLTNTDGRFSTTPTLLPNLASALINPHLGFTDIDRDGDLDILASNWTTGSFSDSYNLGDASNALLINDHGQFQVQSLKCKPGETLSILSTDFNNDNWPDLLVANDFLPPDCFYSGGASGIANLSRDESGFKHSPIHSMSYDSGDINNDGLLDYFATDIADPFNETVTALGSYRSCDDFKNTGHFSACVEAENMRRAVNQKHEYISCSTEHNSGYLAQCQAYVYFLHIMATQTPCSAIPRDWPILRQTCRDARNANHSATTLLPEINAQNHRGNTLHLQQADGSFSNVEQQWGVRHTGWSWNARFADLNHDTWQDLFIVNGYPLQAYDETNLLFLNNHGEGFVNATKVAGIEDSHITLNYSYSDLDNDGDLDILTHSPYGPMNVWLNQPSNGNAIKISLIDQQGNHFGVGAHVTIRYNNQLIQVRELKLSGGFGSNDAPYLHFGLGPYEKIESLEVRWASGSPTTIERSLTANHHYTIERRSH